MIPQVVNPRVLAKWTLDANGNMEARNIRGLDNTQPEHMTTVYIKNSGGRVVAVPLYIGQEMVDNHTATISTEEEYVAWEKNRAETQVLPNVGEFSDKWEKDHPDQVKANEEFKKQNEEFRMQVESSNEKTNKQIRDLAHQVDLLTKILVAQSKPAQKKKK